MKQFEFQKINWKHRLSHGGILRKSRAGRSARPLSSREPLHLVFKANKASIKSGLRTYKRFFLIQSIVQQYAGRFFVRIEQISIQNDHIHLLIRTSRRSQFQNFFRVVAGQIAQRFEKEGLLSGSAAIASVTGTPKVMSAQTASTKPKLWMHRPFTRVIRGWKPYQTIRDYIQLNEQEALGNIRYQKERLRKLSRDQIQELWNGS